MAHEHHHHHEETEHNSALGQWLRPAITLAMLAAGIALTATGAEWFGGGIALAWYLAAFIIIGLPVVKEAVEELGEGEPFSEFMLMTIAAIGAFAIGEYPEAVAVMLFYCIGETLQDMAVDRARGNIKSLAALKPEWARVDGELRRPEEVAVGEVIEVRAGERVPLDGVLLSEAAAFDTAALTGESVPRTIETGDEVMAGMIVSASIVKLRVARVAKESAVERILNMVEEAAERKAPAELFIKRFARIYTPAVCLLALLVATVPWLVSMIAPSLFNGSFQWSTWIYRALVFLVISCPCALVISVPLSYFAGIGAASRLGILFKGSNYLDAISRVKTVVFDKTGTLTTGTFRVAKAERLTEEELGIVAAIEQTSSHPIAKAIVERYKPTATADNVTNIAGYGLSAKIDGHTWTIGTCRLMEKEHVDYPKELKTTAETLVAVARDGEYRGHLLLADTPKADAAEAVSRLKQMGVGSVILSGDKQDLVNKVAAELGVDKAYGDLLPQDKATHIEQLKSGGEQVAFVGDGINDAPVLALSDVGIAMGAMGSDMAIETADVVVQNDCPSRVASAIGIGRRTRSIVKQNIVFALVVKVLVMLLGIVGIATMWAAVFADVGVALLCVLNSMRLMRTKENARECR